MKWKKAGLIFDSKLLKDRYFGFAQSPQALVFDDFVRIYFSTRTCTENGKFISHIQFVDIDKNLKKIDKISHHEVIPLGKPGCFDEHGIFPMNVLRFKNKVYAYTCGWSRRVSVSVETGIGLAISENEGFSFKKSGDGPVLTSSLHEPFLVGDPFVKIVEGVFHMWYIYGTSWKKYSDDVPSERTYKIGHAVSQDGYDWKKEGKQLISDAFDDECQALPTFIQIGQKYHLLFCFRQSSDFRKNMKRAYRIGYASSDDLTNWTRDDLKAGIDVSKGSWDSEMVCYPHVFSCDGKVFLLYNGNEFGRHGFGLAELESL